MKLLIFILLLLLSHVDKPWMPLCPNCGSDKVKIISQTEFGSVTYECKKCGFIFGVYVNPIPK